MTTLIGREAELAVLEKWIDSTAKRGAALVVRGAPGIGKSALLDATAARAASDGMRVLRASGSRSEAHLAFAGLHQLLRPLLNRTSRRDRRLDVLSAALRMADAPMPGPFQVALATLELLAQEAATTPLLIVVDDAHWLDAPTTQVLGSLARRLGSEPAGLLIAYRDGYGASLEDVGVPDVRVGPLDRGSSALLVDARAPGLGVGARDRVLEESAGYPLALVELSAAAAADSSPALGFGSPRQVAVPPRLERALVDRVGELPAATQSVVLVAAADGEAETSEVLSAARLAGEATICREDLAPAVASGLVEQDGSRVKFCHPLLAAAIYQASAPGERHRAHAALAAVVIDRPDRRAWHRAAESTSPDEEVAAGLEASARQAASHNPAEITLAALERAAELTPEAGRRPRRLLQAAEFALDLGKPGRADWLVAGVDLGVCDGLDCARLALVRDMIDPTRLADGTRLDELVEASGRSSSTGEVDIAVRLLHAAAMRSWWTDAAPEVRGQVVAAVKRLPALEGDPCVLAILAVADPTRHAGRLIEAASRLCPDCLDPAAAHWLGAALHAAGALDRAAPFLATAAAGLRTQGRRGLHTQALAQQAWCALATGNWQHGRAAANEAVRLAQETSQPIWEAIAHAALGMIAAVQGDEASAQSHTRHAEAIALPLGCRAVLADLLFVRSLLALGDGRYEEAFDHLQRTFDPDDPAHHSFSSLWCIGEIAESGARSGHLDDARERLRVAEAVAQNTTSPRLQIGLLYARPLLAEDNENTEAQFQAGLTSELARWPFYRARLLLEYGAWLRRRRRVTQARMPLRAAHEAFVALGAHPWVKRTQQELRASREAPPLQQADSFNQLTDQERQIASLAAEGLSNRDIAERLYISARTVGSHLYHIFPKLGISSRTQLRAALENSLATAMAS